MSYQTVTALFYQLYFQSLSLGRNTSFGTNVKTLVALSFIVVPDDKAIQVENIGNNKVFIYKFNKRVSELAALQAG